MCNRVIQPSWRIIEFRCVTTTWPWTGLPSSYRHGPQLARRVRRSDAPTVPSKSTGHRGRCPIGPAARTGRTYRRYRYHQGPTDKAGPPQAGTRTRPVHGPTARYRNLCRLAQLARIRPGKRSMNWSGQPSGPCSLITGGVRYNPSHEAQESGRHPPRGGGRSAIATCLRSSLRIGERSAILG